MSRPYRIAVVGATGSGKTTLAVRISSRLAVPHIELDALHWLPDWTERPLPEFRAAVARTLAEEAWVVDGNYSKVRDLVWTRADTLVWLDYPLGTVLWRLGRRTIRRVHRRELLWDANRERLRAQFASRDSLFLWALKTHGRHRREYPALLTQAEYGHLALVRLRRPRLAVAWLETLAPVAD